MEGRHFCYPEPQWFQRALGGSYAETWIDDCRLPHWYRPAALSVFAPRNTEQIDRRAGGDAADLARAEQLRQEMALFRRRHGAPARLAEIYWSAGVTGLTERALKAVHAAVNACFDVDAAARFTARLSVTSWQPALLPALREYGVTTLHAACAPTDSLRCASLEQFVAQARKAGFNAIAIDMPIDVPRVSMRSVREWVAALSACRPSRIFLTRSGERSSVRADTRLSGHGTRTEQAWRETYANLIAAGYEYVASDVFAVHADEFVKAKQTATLTPTPFGYSICPSHVSIAIGRGAIGHVGPMQYQNARDSRSYAALLRRETLPVERALVSTRDDLVRRAVIAGVYTNFSVDIETIEASYGIDFREAFRPELIALERLEREGLVEHEETQLRLTSAGRFASRRVADVFDRYAQQLAKARSGRGGL